MGKELSITKKGKQLLASISNAQEKIQKLRTSIKQLTNNNFLDASFATAPIAIIHSTKTGKIIRANNSCEKMFHYSQVQLQSIKIQELLLPADSTKKNNAKITALYETKFPTNKRYKTKDGAIRYCVVTHTFFYSQNSPTPQVITTLIDITTAQLIEQALKESELKYRALIENTPDIIIRTDTTGTIVYSNSAVNEIIDALPADLMGQNINKISLPKELLEKIKPHTKNAIKRKSTTLFEYEFYHNSQHFFYDWRIIPEFDNSNNLTSLLNISRNINSRKEIELELRQEKQFITQLMETSPIGIIVITKNKKISYANSWAEIILQINRNELTEASLNNGYIKISDYEGDPIPEKKQIFEEIFTTKLPTRNCRYLITWKDDTKKYLSINGEPLFNKQGELDKAIFTLEDITTAWEHEKKLKQSLIEKELLVREIHHRVKNNLAIILSIIQFERDSMNDQHIIQILKKIESRIYSISLVHQLLHKSQSTSIIDVQNYFERLIIQLRNTYTTKAHKIEWEVDFERIELSIAISKTLGLIINEIIANALKHAFSDSQNGRISSKLYKNQDSIILSIKDNGQGIPQHVHEGTTGLHLIRLLCEEIRSDLQIKKETGTEYVITIPATTE